MGHITARKEVVGSGKAAQVAGNGTAPIGPASVLINSGDMVAFQQIELIVQLKIVGSGAGMTCQRQQVLAIIEKKAIPVDQVDPAGVGDEKVFIMVEEMTEDIPPPVGFLSGRGAAEKGGEIKKLSSGIDQEGFSEGGGIDRPDQVAVIAGVAIEVVVVGLKIDRTLAVRCEIGNIGFHFRFVIRVIKIKSVTVEPDEANLGCKP